MVWEFLFLGFILAILLGNKVDRSGNDFRIDKAMEDSQLVLEPLQPAEVEIGFNQRILIAVAAVHGVALDAFGEALADSSFGCVGRVGGANQLAEVFNSIFFFENSRYDRAFGHKGNELSKEATLFVYSIELFGLLFRKAGKLHRLNFIACADDDVEDLSGMAVCYCIGLNHGECYFSSHFEG
jgi:hypothetical protein